MPAEKAECRCDFVGAELRRLPSVTRIARSGDTFEGTIPDDPDSQTATSSEVLGYCRTTSLAMPKRLCMSGKGKSLFSLV